MTLGHLYRVSYEYKALDNRINNLELSDYLTMTNFTTKWNDSTEQIRNSTRRCIGCWNSRDLSSSRA